jgi:hypothetical protein
MYFHPWLTNKATYSNKVYLPLTSVRCPPNSPVGLTWWSNASGLWWRVDMWVDTNVSKKHIASFFRDEIEKECFSETLATTDDFTLSKTQKKAVKSQIPSCYESSSPWQFRHTTITWVRCRLPIVSFSSVPISPYSQNYCLVCFSFPSIGSNKTSALACSPRMSFLHCVVHTLHRGVHWDLIQVSATGEHRRRNLSPLSLWFSGL